MQPLIAAAMVDLFFVCLRARAVCGVAVLPPSVCSKASSHRAQARLTCAHVVLGLLRCKPVSTRRYYSGPTVRLIREPTAKILEGLSRAPPRKVWSGPGRQNIPIFFRPSCTSPLQPPPTGPPCVQVPGLGCRCDCNVIDRRPARGSRLFRVFPRSAMGFRGAINSLVACRERFGVCLSESCVVVSRALFFLHRARTRAGTGMVRVPFRVLFLFASASL